MPTQFSVAAVDPGLTTGVARGVFDTSTYNTVPDVFRAAIEFESWECKGTIEEQSIELTEELADWFSEQHLFRSIPIPNLFLVFEDFQLRTRFARLEGVRLREQFKARWTFKTIDIDTQQPSHAKRYATDERLRRWGAWTKGSTHRRDATRHLLLRLSKVID